MFLDNEAAWQKLSKEFLGEDDEGSEGEVTSEDSEDDEIDAEQLSSATVCALCFRFPCTSALLVRERLGQRVFVI